MAERNARQAMVPEGAERAGEFARHRARSVARSGRAHRHSSARPAARTESHFHRASRAAPRAPGRRRRACTHANCAPSACPNRSLDERIAPIYKRYGDVQTTILAGLGEIQIHLRTWSKDVRAAERMLDELVERIALALGESVFTVQRPIARGDRRGAS